jgi:acetylornithine deacetylase/succinyl-diaminopimelate desuccinylase-like protein
MKTVVDFLTMTPEQVFKTVRAASPNRGRFRPDLYLWIDNNNPITLVAHVDTVRRHPEPPKLDITRDVIRARNSILGADDRAGCYAIYRLLQARQKAKKPLPNILLTDLEESGGLGARAAATDIDFLATKTRLFVELDRQGATEYVFYSRALPDAIKRYVESFGYSEQFGSYSDIAEFDECRIPAVNLSVGYYRQHSKDERLHVDEMMLTVSRVDAMLDSPPTKRYLVPIARPFWQDTRDGEDEVPYLGKIGGLY